MSDSQGDTVEITRLISCRALEGRGDAELVIFVPKEVFLSKTTVTRGVQVFKQS